MNLLLVSLHMVKCWLAAICKHDPVGMLQNREICLRAKVAFILEVLAVLQKGAWSVKQDYKNLFKYILSNWWLHPQGKHKWFLGTTFDFWQSSMRVSCFHWNT